MDAFVRIDVMINVFFDNKLWKILEKCVFKCKFN